MQILSWLRSFRLELQKKIEEEKVNEKEEQWTQVQKHGNKNQGPRKKGKDSKPINVSVVGKPSYAPQAVNSSTSNQFDALSSDTLEEGDLRQLDGIELEDPLPHLTSQVLATPSTSVSLWAGEPSLSSPIGEVSPPSYA